jgi:hypothetical protein
MHLGLVDRSFVPLTGIVPSFISRGTPHHAAREASISEGRKLNIQIFPATRNELQLLGSFTCPKVGAWDFLSEGRHAEDFYIRKIRRLRLGLNPRTREPEASMLTSRPPKPLSWVELKGEVEQGFQIPDRPSLCVCEETEIFYVSNFTTSQTQALFGAAVSSH